MWFVSALIIILVFLLIVVIMDTSMKLALMITTLYNYDSKKLFIPACLTVIVWTILILACLNTINKSLDNNALDMIFSMIIDKSLIQGYEGLFTRSLLSTFILGTFLQSFTYYAVNINYQKVTGTIRFSIKKLFKSLMNKIVKNNKSNNSKNDANLLAEIEIKPKKLTFPRAILTSIISALLTILICYILFRIGTILSGKIMTML